MNDELQGMLEELGRAINAHDAEAIGRCWAEDGNFVDLWGRFAAGRQQVVDYFAREFGGAFANARFRASKLDLRPLGEETVVGECEAVFENVVAPNGRPYDFPHRIDAVFVRRGGRWFFFSAHPSFRRA